MARKKQKVDPVAEHRERIAGSVARIETKLETLLARQEEDRETIGKALQLHTEHDAANFQALNEKQAKTDKVVNRGIGGVIVLQIILSLLVAAGVLQF